MRNILSIKGIPAPLTEEGFWWSEELWLISYIDSNWDTVITMQDKNIWATKVQSKYWYDWTSRVSSWAEYEWVYKNSSQEFIDAWLVPSWYHLMTYTEATEILRPAWAYASNYDMFSWYYYLYIPYCKFGLDWTNTRTSFTGDRYKNPTTTSWWSYCTRLVADTIVQPVSKGRVKITQKERQDVTITSQTFNLTQTDYNLTGTPAESFVYTSWTGLYVSIQEQWVEPVLDITPLVNILQVEGLTGMSATYNNDRQMTWELSWNTIKFKEISFASYNKPHVNFQTITLSWATFN